MDPKELKRILDALVETEVNEFALETPEYKLSIKRGAGQAVYAPVAMPQVQHMPQLMHAPVAAPVATEAVSASNTEIAAVAAASTGQTIKAPIVGTFYRSPTPDQPAFVNVGDRVEVGKVLCIIEAMKLMNEIEAEVSGVIKEILVQNAQPVEYGQPLFVIE